MALFAGGAATVLTQSAVSKRIAQLESQLGCRLFDRIGRQVMLTEAGLALLPRARQILLSIEDAERLLGNLSGRIGGAWHWPPATTSVCTAYRRS